MCLKKKKYVYTNKLFQECLDHVDREIMEEVNRNFDKILKIARKKSSERQRNRRKK